MTGRNGKRVAVCVATRRRPKSLARLLERLSLLTFSKVPEPTLEVIVIDNDSDASARAVVVDAEARLRWPVRYHTEPCPGISIARNRAIEVAGPEVDLIAFIDDDETPAPEWLDELLATQMQYAADIVAGPVLPCFEAPVAAWLARGHFYHRPRYPSGSPIDHIATNNVLFRSAIFFAAGIRFRDQLSLAGGHDVLFFLEARRAGFRAVWADAAWTEEWIPASRATARWLLLRAYSGGNAFSHCQLAMEPALKTRLSRIVRCTARVVVSLIAIPTAVRGGRPTLLRALMGVMRGVGGVAGVVGAPYEEYRTTHGA